MKKIKKIAAWAVIIILTGLYASSFVLALLDSEYARKLLTVSVYLTVVLPVIMYALALVTRVMDKKEDQKDMDKEN